MLEDCRLGPLVVLAGSDHELHLIRGTKLGNIGPTIAFNLAAARTFQIHDAPNPRIELGNVMGPAGFHQHRETIIRQGAHQASGIGLQKGFTPGQLNQRQLVLS